MYGCDTEYTTSNYGVTTTPRNEFEIAMGLRECPERDMLDRKGHKVRVIHRIDALRTLDICRRAGLTDDEILVVVSAAVFASITAQIPYLRVAICAPTLRSVASRGRVFLGGRTAGTLHRPHVSGETSRLPFVPLSPVAFLSVHLAQSPS
jgi:hypothetical protein